jgi:hypothetical protein
MHSEVSVTFRDCPPVRIDLNEVLPMPHESARKWLDDQFTEMGCEPLMPTGLAGFADAQWAQDFARAASAALAKPMVHIDADSFSISY